MCAGSASFAQVVGMSRCPRLRSGAHAMYMRCTHRSDCLHHPMHLARAHSSVHYASTVVHCCNVLMYDSSVVHTSTVVNANPLHWRVWTLKHSRDISDISGCDGWLLRAATGVRVLMKPPRGRWPASAARTACTTMSSRQLAVQCVAQPSVCTSDQLIQCESCVRAANAMAADDVILVHTRFKACGASQSAVL